MLIAILTMHFSIFLMPGIILEFSRQYSWVSMCIAVLGDILMAAILYALGQMYPGRTLFEYPQLILGRLAGKLFALVFALFFLYVGGIILRIFTECSLTYLLDETPFLFLLLLGITTTGYYVYKGLTVIVRLGELVAPIIFIVVPGLLLSVSPKISLANLVVVDWTWLGIFRGALIQMAMFGVCILMGVFMAFHDKPGQSFRVKVRGVIISGVLITALFLVSLGVLGEYAVAQTTFPTESLARLIEFPIDPLILAVLVMGGSITISILYFAASLGLAQTVGLANYRWLIIPAGVMIMLEAAYLLGDNIVELKKHLSTVFPVVALPVELGMTSFLLLAAWIKRHSYPP